MKPPEEKYERKTLSIPEAAELIGVTTTIIWRAVKSGVVPSFKRKRAIYIAKQDLLKVAVQLQHKDVAPKKAVAGELAGECFERFARGQDPVTIVRELRQDPTVVDRLWDQWRALQEKWHLTKPTPCVLAHKGPCSGPPSIDAKLCAVHAEKATVLSSEEELTLAGKEIPKALRCDACSEMLFGGFCGSCFATTTITVEGGALLVRIGKKILKVEALSTLGLRPIEIAETPPSEKPARVKYTGRDAEHIIEAARKELGMKDT